MNFVRLWHRIVWIRHLAWESAPFPLLGFLIATFLESLLPAALVLTGRGLINALVAGLQDGHGDMTRLLPWLVLGATLAVCNALIGNLGDYWQQYLQDELNLRVGLDVLTQASRLDLAFLESSEAQDHVERSRQYGSPLVAQVLLKLVTVLSQSIRFCSLVSILLWIEPLVAGWLCLLTLPYWLFKLRLANRTYAMRHRRTTKQRQTYYYTRLLTDPHWLPEVKFFALAPLLIQRFRTLSSEFLVADRQLYWLSLLGNTIFATIGAFTLYALFGRIAGRVLTGSLTVGDVAIYTGSAMQLQSVLQALVQTIASLNEQLLHLTDLQTFLALQPSTGATQPQTEPENVGTMPYGKEEAAPLNGKPTSSNGTHKRPCKPLTLSPSHQHDGAIEFDNVSFTYPNNDQPVLSNLSFALEPGETVALVGENGAGKSTLAMLLARLYEPTAGAIRVDGVDLRTIDPATWQQQIGFVFQKFALFEATVRENIAYGNWAYLNEYPAAVEQLAQQAQADAWISSLPDGYETLLGRQFAKRDLSVGQWQKLALARGLARTDARLLILDEPSASLDARAEYELFNYFKQAASGRTTVLISHRFSTISMADRIFVLDRGRLIEIGTHDLLLAQGGHYAGLYQLHRQQYDSSAATDAVHSTQ